MFTVVTEPMGRCNMNEKLIIKTKEKSEKLLKHTLDTIVRMANEGIEVNYFTVAKEAKVSRPYLYRHPEIRAKIDACRISKMTKDELRNEVIRLRTTNK